MSRRIVGALAVLLASTLALAGLAAAGPSAKKQRVIINQLEDIGKGKWTLLPWTSGPVASDKGTYTWKTTVDRRGMRDGQSYRHVVATVTYVGANGLFVVREDDTLVAASSTHTVATGTWRILRGTGAYEGVTGGGSVVGALGFGRPDPWRYEGFMTSP